MKVHLTPDHKRFVRMAVTEGQYEDASDVIRDALRHLVASRTQNANWAVLGSMNGQDIEAIAFLVLMQAAKSAQEDLKAIMAAVKAVNSAKANLRELLMALVNSPKGRRGRSTLSNRDRMLLVAWLGCD